MDDLLRWLSNGKDDTIFGIIRRVLFFLVSDKGQTGWENIV